MEATNVIRITAFSSSFQVGLLYTTSINPTFIECFIWSRRYDFVGYKTLWTIFH